MDKKGRRFAEEKTEQTKVVHLGEEKQATTEHADDDRLREKNDKKLDKLMKKQRKREARSHREVLTFEDMPLAGDEDKHPDAARSNTKRVAIAVVIVAVVFVLVFLFANSDRFSIHNISNFIQYGVLNRNSEQSFPVSVQGENITPGNFLRVGQDLTFASDTKLQTVNNYGKTLSSEQHGFSNPIVVASDSYVLVYNLGGSGYLLKEQGSDAYTAASDDNILTADICSNGTYALVTQSDGYLSKLQVFDNEHNRIFAYSFADYYITSVSLNSSGRYAVLSGVSALNGEGISSLYVLDFTKDTPLYFKEFEGGVIYRVMYLNDSHACAVGNTASYVINTRSGEVQVSSYEGRQLTAFDINTDTDTYTLALSRSGDGRNCEICSYNSGGALSKSFSVEDKIVDLSTYKNRVAVLTDEKVFLYNKDGYLNAEQSAGLDPHAIVLYTTADAYILSTSEINTLSF